MRARLTTLVVALGAGLTLAGKARPAGADPAGEAESVPVRIAYTEEIIRNTPESDFKAAIKVWSEALAEEMSVRAHAEVQVAPGASELARLVEARRIDFGCATTPEFLEIESRLDVDPIFSVARGGISTVDYVVLVRQESGYEQLSGLRGADVKLLASPHCSLALPWVEVLLARQGVSSAEAFFGRLSRAAKLPAVVLPVFFKQADACIVTRDGYQTMVDLNPQVGRELRVLAASSGLVPLLAFFRRDFRPYFRNDLIHSMLTLDESPAGRQIQNLMKGDAMVVIPPAALESTRALMREWSRRPARPGTASLGGIGR